MFCAICADDSGPFVPRPLGKNDAIVNVCRDCDEEPAVTKNGPERGYEIQEGMSTKDFAESLREFLAETDPITAREKMTGPLQMLKGRERTPGWIMVRLHINKDGKPRECTEALRDLVDRPWFRELRYLGATHTYFLLERPDPAVAAESRRASENPLIDLSLFKVDC